MKEINNRRGDQTDPEAALLGNIMFEDATIFDIHPALQPKHFANLNNQKVFGVIQELKEKSMGIDLVTVTNRLKAKDQLSGELNAVYLTSLTASVTANDNLQEYSLVIIQKYLQRRIAETGQELMLSAMHNDPFDAYDAFSKEVADLHLEFEGLSETPSLDDVLDEVVKDYYYRKDNADRNGLIGVPTGFTVLDDFTSGWQGGDMILLAARPSMGKTAVSLKMAKAATEKKIPTLYVSLEMAQKKILGRIFCSYGLDPKEFKQGQLSQEDESKLNALAHKLKEEHMFHPISEPFELNLLIPKIRAMVRKMGIGLVVIDYITLIKTSGIKGLNTQNDRVGYLSASIKQMAKELDIPVVVLSQLNREVEKRPNKRPTLADLRDSGALEQDADVVVFLYRQYYYDDKAGVTCEEPEKCEMTVAKNREGATGMFYFYSSIDMTDIGDWKGSNDPLTYVKEDRERVEPKF